MITLLLNNALRLYVKSYVSNFNQSACIISETHCNSTLKHFYEIYFSFLTTNILPLQMKWVLNLKFFWDNIGSLIFSILVSPQFDC